MNNGTTKDSKNYSVKDKNEKLETNSSGNGHIDQIRDILFGDQMRNIYKETEQLKTDIHTDLSNFNKEQQKQIEELRTKFQQEINQLNNRVEGISKELKTVVEEVKQNLLEEIKNLSNEIYENNKKMNNTIQQQTQELDRNKTDRKTLAKIFSDIAKQFADKNKPISERLR